MNANNKFSNIKKQVFNKKTLKKFFIGSSTTKKMFRLYFLILLIFACLLYLPISIQPFEVEGFGGSLYNLQYTNNHYVMNLWEFNFDEVTEVGKWAVSKTISFNFFDCLFSAFSAFSDTGLTVVSTAQVFSTFGKIILMLLIQIGGFGIMFFIFVIWKMFRKIDKITIGQTLLAQSEKGNTKIGDTEKMLIASSICILIIEVVFGLFYSLWFLEMPAYVPVVKPNSPFTQDSNVLIDLYHNAGNAFFAGFFHSVSAVNNAGFSIIGDNSLAAYRNGVNSIFLLATTIQFIIGGIGFPIVYDFMEKVNIIKKSHPLFKKYHWYTFRFHLDKRHRLSLFTKICTSTYFIILFLSIGLAFLFECTYVGGGTNALWNDYSNAFGSANNSSLSYYNKSVQIMFQTMSTRSAGFDTFDNSFLNPSSKWLNIFLMYVGGSPSSTAGGIRVTTFAIIVLAVWARIRGKVHVNAFKRSFLNNDIKNSFIVAFVGIVICCLGGIIITSGTIGNSDQDSFTNALFISASAFGTTGLSTTNVADFDWFAKLYLMLLMFIGQYGISSTLLVFRRSKVKTNTFQYISEGIRIG